jgi:hypothetical protein
VSGAGFYADNAVAMWRSLAPSSIDSADHFRAELPDTTRILIRRPAVALRHSWR